MDEMAGKRGQALVVLSKQEACCIPDIRMLPCQDGSGQDPLNAAAPNRAPVAGHPRLHWACLLPPFAVIRLLHSTQHDLLFSTQNCCVQRCWQHHCIKQHRAYLAHCFE